MSSEYSKLESHLEMDETMKTFDELCEIEPDLRDAYQYALEERGNGNELEVWVDIEAEVVRIFGSYFCPDLKMELERFTRSVLSTALFGPIKQIDVIH